MKARLAGMVLAAGLVLAGCSSGPSYPHAWCGTVITNVTTHEPDSTYQRAMSKATGPGAKLYADQQVFQQDNAAAQSASNETVFGADAIALGDLSKIKADLTGIAAACKVSASKLINGPHSAG